MATPVSEAAEARTQLLDAELTERLVQRLPQHAAPLALKRRLAARLSRPPVAPARRPQPVARLRQFAAPMASAAAAAALVLIGLRGFVAPGAPAPAGELVQEGVNDHLRVVASAHPVEIESGGIHQVKPWFTGRLEFAPPVSFSGDDEFPLVGGNVGYFRDRKAAVFVFKHKLHVISLYVFRADGLPWPAGAHDHGMTRTSLRGFNVRLWRAGELGYCLTSDVDGAQLDKLVDRLGPEVARTPKQ